MSTAKNTTRRTSLLATLGAAALLLAAAAPASAPAAVKWGVESVADTTVVPGSQFTYYVHIANLGDTPSDGSTVTFAAQLPSGLKLVSATPFFGKFEPQFNCSASVPGSAAATCTTEAEAQPGTLFGFPAIKITVEVEDPAPAPLLSTSFTVSGGETPTPSTSISDPTRIASEAPAFAIDAFDMQAFDDADAPSTDAAAVPAGLTTRLDFSRGTDAFHGALWPTEQVKNIVVDSPAGFAGNATVTAGQFCTLGQLANSAGIQPRALCPVGSQIGVTSINGVYGEIFPGSGESDAILGPFPVFNMVRPPGVAVRFGFNAAGSVVVLDAKARGGGDYGATVSARNVPGTLALFGSSLTLWGTPADPIHNPERVCPGEPPPIESGPTCPPETEPTAFLRNPTACAALGEGLPVAVRVDSWEGSSDSRSIFTHDLPGYPSDPSEWGAEQGPDNCEAVPFEPSISVQPSTDEAASPTGLTVDLSLPQTCWEPNQVGTTCQSDLKKAVVTLPEGMSVNPSQADGLGACTTEQIGLLGTDFPAPAPIHFTDEAPNCPNASKIGSAEVTTPLLDHKIEAGVYLAAQGDNPFDSLLAMYIAGRDAESGTTVKLAGKIEVDPNTGRLTTVFDNQPQVPFSLLHLVLKSGPRAALINPPSCGTHTVTTQLTGWSGAGADPSGSFQLTKGPNGGPCPNGGFDPELNAGTTNPLAGATSPFNLRLTREDGTQELGGLTATLPPGLSGYLKGIPYCSDAALAGVSGDEGTGNGQIASPSCPATSQVGTVTVGAGAGPNPFYTSAGRAYLAGPYKGAPLSLAVVTPAVAGPFDLGSVVVRNALRVDPVTAQITAVSDPLPSILHGIPLDLRDVRVELNRDHFTLNPTSCDEMQIASTITSTQGATASPSDRFQVAGCDKLGFKPRLSLRLKGGTRRSEHPALTAVMQPRLGDANAARISVALPHSEFLAQSHIRTICTRVQYAADACPAGSIYGKVTATTPIVDYPLTGNLYLRSSDNPLPDMVLALHGPAHQPIEIDAVGRIDSKNGGIRTTFETLPDQPLTKVVLQLPGGQKSLIENSTNICRSRQRATVKMDGQNGKVHDFRPELKVKCGGKSKRKAGAAR